MTRVPTPRRARYSATSEPDSAETDDGDLAGREDVLSGGAEHPYLSIMLGIGRAAEREAGNTVS